MRPSLAVVTSLDEACGIAGYAVPQFREYSRHYDAQLIPLKVRVLRSGNRYLRRYGDRHIAELARTLRKFDRVHLHFEAGLYGTSPSDIIRRMRILVGGCRNVIIDLHSLELRRSIFDPVEWRGLNKGGFLERAYRILSHNRRAKIYRSLAKLGAPEARVHFVVHTKREKELAEMVVGLENVFDYPLTYLSKERKETLGSPAARHEFRHKHGLGPADVAIGIFGFIAPYKGHDTAIRALTALPPRYRLFVFGAQHPQSIVPHQKADPFFEELLKIIESPAGTAAMLKHRVRFLGGASDDEFARGMYGCDFTVLPYVESSQSGSGPAAMALETRAKALFSNNLCFKELSRYCPEGFVTFDIGNHLELAQKLLSYRHDFSPALDAYNGNYNVEKSVEFHRSIFEGADHAEAAVQIPAGAADRAGARLHGDQAALSE
jgi:glycosyltransferase involved in cell wall biosynthesis